MTQLSVLRSAARRLSAGAQPAFLRDYGSYYPDFGAEAEGVALLDAFLRHDAERDTYRASVAPLLARLAPIDRDAIAVHERLLSATDTV